MAEQTAVGSEEKPLKELAEDLIREQTTLTLATAHADKPWAAPVYYVYRRSVFYFFSDPKTRHIDQAMATGQAAAAISAPGARWQEIRGIQMVGRIEQVHGKIEALEAIRGYLKKFPFTKEFFGSEQKINLEAFLMRFKVRLYRFSPLLVYYLDNSIKFGFREEVVLTP